MTKFNANFSPIEDRDNSVPILATRFEELIELITDAFAASLDNSSNEYLSAPVGFNRQKLINVADGENPHDVATMNNLRTREGAFFFATYDSEKNTYLIDLGEDFEQKIGMNIFVKFADENEYVSPKFQIKENAAKLMLSQGNELNPGVIKEDAVGLLVLTSRGWEVIGIIDLSNIISQEELLAEIEEELANKVSIPSLFVGESPFGFNNQFNPSNTNSRQGIINVNGMLWCSPRDSRNFVDIIDPTTPPPWSVTTRILGASRSRWAGHYAPDENRIYYAIRGSGAQQWGFDLNTNAEFQVPIQNNDRCGVTKCRGLVYYTRATSQAHIEVFDPVNNIQLPNIPAPSNATRWGIAADEASGRLFMPRLTTGHIDIYNIESGAWITIAGIPPNRKEFCHIVGDKLYITIAQNVDWFIEFDINTYEWRMVHGNRNSHRLGITDINGLLYMGSWTNNGIDIFNTNIISTLMEDISVDLIVKRWRSGNDVNPRSTYTLYANGNCEITYIFVGNRGTTGDSVLVHPIPLIDHPDSVQVTGEGSFGICRFGPESTLTTLRVQTFSAAGTPAASNSPCSVTVKGQWN